MPVREKADDYRLWSSRIDQHMNWLTERQFNSWASWTAAYELDRAKSWLNKVDMSELSGAEYLSSKMELPILAVHIRKVATLLSYSEPFFTINSKDPADARAQQDYLNFFWRLNDLTSHLNEVVLDCTIIGWGVANTGWLSDPARSDTPGIDNITYGLPFYPKTPFVKRVNPFNFFWDKNSHRLRSSRWCVEIIFRSLVEVVEDPNYNEEIRKALENREITPKTYDEHQLERQLARQDEEQLGLFDEQESEFDYQTDTSIVLYKIYDRLFNREIVLLAGHEDDALSDKQNPYSYLPFQFPYRVVRFTKIPDEHFGIGHIRYLGDLYKHLTRNWSTVFANSRARVNQYVHKGQEPIDDHEASKLNQQTPDAVINIKPTSTLNPLDRPRVAEEVQLSLQLGDKLWSEISGDDVLARSGLLPSRTSAREVQERTRLRGLNLESASQEVKNFFLAVGRDLLLHAKEWSTQDVVVEAIGRYGEFWTDVSRKNLEATSSVHLDVISKPDTSPEVRQQQVRSLMELLLNPNFLQLLQMQQVPFDVAELLRILLDTYEMPALALAFPSTLTEPKTIPENFVPQATAPLSKEPSGGEQLPDSVQEQAVNPISLLQGLMGQQGGKANA